MTSSRRTRGLAVKRAMDVVLSACGLLVLSPLLLIVAILIRLRLGSPVLFRQLRPGLHGRPFELVKFRSMTNHVDEQGELLPEDQRLTRLGGVMRKFSIDELPELWNVLKGQMSLVGPRPLLMEYLPRYSAEQMRRHDMRPGITGLAQTRGRHKVGWDERFALDLWYVDNWSLRLDATAIRETFAVLGEGQSEFDLDEEDYYFMGSPGEPAMDGGDDATSSVAPEENENAPTDPRQAGMDD